LDDTRASGKPGIVVAPFTDDGIVRAVEEGGGRLVEAPQAEAVVWTDPGDPESLGKLLEESSAGWVQLPLAGLERFFASGVIDSSRVWTCAKGIYVYACAEHAVALTLAAARVIHTHARDQSWRPAGFQSPHRLLRGSTVLIVGTGGIGSATVPLLQPFGVRILAVNRSGRPLQGAERTVAHTGLAEVVSEADFTVLAAPLTASTAGMFDWSLMARMKPAAWLINVARGGLILTDDLVAALEEGSIGGAALDVTDPEPLPDGHPLWRLDNAIITPHIANTISMSLPQLRDLVRRNVRKYAAGESLEGLVDPALGY